jgi:hypothetical protein
MIFWRGTIVLYAGHLKLGIIKIKLADGGFPLPIILAGGFSV